MFSELKTGSHHINLYAEGVVATDGINYAVKSQRLCSGGCFQAVGLKTDFMACQYEESPTD